MCAPLYSITRFAIKFLLAYIPRKPTRRREGGKRAIVPLQETPPHDSSTLTFNGRDRKASRHHRHRSNGNVYWRKPRQKQSGKKKKSGSGSTPIICQEKSPAATNTERRKKKKKRPQLSLFLSRSIRSGILFPELLLRDIHTHTQRHGPAVTSELSG